MFHLLVIGRLDFLRSMMELLEPFICVKRRLMAGLALERKQPIHTCHLKEDRSGNVRPGAKAVDAQPCGAGDGCGR